MMYLTLFKDGKMLPDGLSTEAQDSPTMRYRMLAVALESLGYEASFAAQPGDMTGTLPDEGYEVL